MKFTNKALLVAGAAIALSACEDHPGATPTSTASPTSETALPADLARANAVEAYRQMWASFVAAGRSSDWRAPNLGHHATGIALNKLSESLYGDQYKGLVTKGEPILRPTVSSVEPADDPKKVIITDCGDSTNWLKYRKDNGTLADDKPGGRHLINAVVEKQTDGSWKVSDYGVHDTGTC